MADFVHCNKCFCNPQPSGAIKFFITSCGHVFCRKCIDAGAVKPCLMCKAKSPTTIEVGRNMPSNVQRYFLDPAELARKHAKVLQDVVNFQKQQRADYLKMTMKQVSLAEKAVVAQRVSLAELEATDVKIRSHAQKQDAKIKQLSSMLKSGHKRVPHSSGHNHSGGRDSASAHLVDVSATPLAGGGAAWQHIKPNSRFTSPDDIARRHKSPSSDNRGRSTTPHGVHHHSSSKARASHRVCVPRADYRIPQRSPYGDLAMAIMADRLSLKGTPENVPSTSRRRTHHSGGSAHSSTIRNLLGR